MTAKTRFSAMAALVALAAVLVPTLARAGAQARIVGTVVDYQRNPIPNAKIVITNPKVPSFKMELDADDKGVFRTLIADSTYSYMYTVSADCCDSLQVEKKAAIGSEVSWEFQLLPKGSGQGEIPAEAPKSEKAKVAFNEGVGHLAAKNFPEAEKKFLEATVLHPELIDAWRALAKVAVESKNGAKAVEYAKTALELKEKELADAREAGDAVDDAELAGFLKALGDAYELAGDKANAKTTRDRLAQVTGDPSAMYNEAVDLFNKNKMKEAEGKLKGVLEMKEDYPLAHYLIGMIQMNGGKNKDAKKHFDRYMVLAPDGDKAEEVKAFLSYLK